MIFEADYKITPQVYTIFYYIDGINGYPDGVIDDNDFFVAKELSSGTYIQTPNVPERQYYQFYGWYANENFTQASTYGTMPATDIRLYGYYSFDVREKDIPIISLENVEINDNLEDVVVTATILKNTGFNGLVLTLNYDRDALIFDHFEKAEKLSEMQFDTTNTEDMSIENFKFYYEAAENNKETGDFLILYFKLKPGIEENTYKIWFEYEEHKFYYAKIEHCVYIIYHNSLFFYSNKTDCIFSDSADTEYISKCLNISTINDYDEYKPREIEKSIPYEDRIQMKILKRSMEQEKAIEHLKKILYPEKQLLAEKEYQGFNKALNEKDMMKKREIEMADKARKIQIEKMKKSLDYNIDYKRRRKNEEKKIDQKYREMLDKDYELFLDKEKKEKNEKAEKMEIYRKMLDEQIEQKNQLMIEENNLSEKNEDFDLVEN